jgi:hypothetical protein
MAPQMLIFGVVLHLKTKNLDFKNFFDLNNIITELLYDKGLRSEFVFSFN